MYTDYVDENESNDQNDYYDDNNSSSSSNDNKDKIKKIACRSLKGFGCNSGLRIIYAYFKEENVVEFLQCYHKNESENEDRTMIKEYLNKMGLNIKN